MAIAYTWGFGFNGFLGFLLRKCYSPAGYGDSLHINTWLTFTPEGLGSWSLSSIIDHGDPDPVWLGIWLLHMSSGQYLLLDANDPGARLILLGRQRSAAAARISSELSGRHMYIRLLNVYSYNYKFEFKMVKRFRMANRSYKETSKQRRYNAKRYG